MLAQWDGVGADSRNTVNQLSVRACIIAFRATNTVERGAYSVDCGLQFSPQNYQVSRSCLCSYQPYTIESPHRS